MWMWLWMGFADTDSEIQRFRDAATERRRVGASLQIRNETFHSDWKMLSNHRRTNTNDCDEPTSDHKTKQANFQLILTRSTKAKTGNGHGPWPKRLGTMLWTPRTEDLAKKNQTATMNPRNRNCCSSGAHFQLSHALQISIGNKCNAKQHFKSFAESAKQHANTNKPTRHGHRNWIAISGRLYCRNAKRNYSRYRK